MNIIGIDPGASGALCVLTPNHTPSVITFDGLTEQDLFNAIWVNTALIQCKVFLEHVTWMPSDKSKGATPFKFGKNYGFIRGVLVTMGVPFEDVHASVWQKRTGVGGVYATKAHRKRAHKQMAQQLFPKEKVTLDKADAMLIAEYGYRVTWENR